MKKIIIFIVIVCAVLIGGAIYLSLDKNSDNNQIVGGDQDDHGCINSAGYTWCEATQKCYRAFEEFCESSADNLVKAIKESTGVELLPKGETTFDWLVSDGKILAKQSIAGSLYQNDDVKKADYGKIEKFLNQTYGLDVVNVADGVVGGLRGYNVGYMACALSFKHNQLKENENAPIEIIGDSMTVKLECGYYNPNDINKPLTEQKIKEVLATKYKKNSSDVSVSITRFSENHAVGSVSFLMNGEFGEGGLFLAVNESGQWKVVYDGNGSIDCESIKTDYKFPEELLSGICD